MPINKQQKGDIINNLKDAVKKSSIVIFVNFRGLNVKLANELRRLLRNAGSKYLVARKTLIKKALEVSSFEGDIPKLEGETAVMHTDGDALASASALNNFAKKNKILKILGGIFEGKYIGSDKVIMLASIPPRETLLTQILQIINSPKRGLVVALSEIAKKK